MNRIKCVSRCRRLSHLPCFVTGDLLGSRMLSSQAGKTNESSPVSSCLFGISRTSLGLEHGFVRPVLASIRQLPEVEAALNISSDRPLSHSTIDNLKRASDVFRAFDKGGREYMAVQALLAECQQRLSLYDDAISSLQELKFTLRDSPHNNVPQQYFADDTTLALAKVFWIKGDFQQSLELCETIISTYDDLGESFPTTNLHMASAMTGKALSQLQAMKTLEDAYSVRDFFRVTIRFLERHPPTENTLPQAIALSNGGLAEAVYNIFLEETNDVSVPMTPALKYLFQGLQKTSVGASSSSSSDAAKAVSHTIEASIQANLAWGVLKYEIDRSDRVEKASEYAKNALSFYDAEGIIGKEGLAWVLSVVASCYHHAGSAVTAEGLFQSAISRTNSSTEDPLTMIAVRDAHLLYAKLCTEWDKRSKDAENLQKEADKIEQSLAPTWQGKSSGFQSSFWFWTPGEVL